MMALRPQTRPLGLTALAALMLLLAGMPQARDAEAGEEWTSLQAGRGAPLYTTYAAATERSRFAPDQAYHVQYDNPHRPMAATARWAGEWGVAFAENGRVVLAPTEMVAPPVVDVSLPDRMAWHAEPLPGIELEGRILVHSSSLAMIDLVLHNASQSTRTVTLAPYVAGSRLLSPAAGGDGHLRWQLDHPADAWTIHQEVPHPVRREHELWMHPPAGESWLLGGVNRSVHRRGQEWVRPDSQAVAPLYGMLTRPDGSRPDVAEGRVQVMAYLEEFPESIVTLDSPMGEHSWDGWLRRGMYALETGLLPFADRVYDPMTGWESLDSNRVRLVASLPGEDLAAVWSHPRSLPPATGRLRADLSLAAAHGSAPHGLSVTETETGLRLTWEGDSTATYRVYWRHWKPRLGGDERETFAAFGQEFALARGMGEAVFRQQAEVTGLSHEVQLSRGIRRADGSVERQAFDPAHELFARHLFVAMVGDDGLPGPATETVVHWPFPALREILAGTRAPATDRDAILLPGAALSRSVTLAPGERDTVRVLRAVDASEAALAQARWTGDWLAGQPLEPLSLWGAEQQRVLEPLEPLTDRERMVHLSALNLVRQAVLPPEGRLSRPYFVFSREPQWGWGHGGIVFHEALSLLTLALSDGEAAQRILSNFAAAQADVPAGESRPAGYVPYRIGPYLDETIPSASGLTSSGPFYAWLTLELFKTTGDTAWLREMEPSCAAFAEFWIEERDADEDGLASWGGQAVLESLRDASAVIWDEVAPPDELESVGLNAMLAREFSALAEMARVLENGQDARWSSLAGERAEAIRRHLWDEETGFFYPVVAGIDGRASRPDPERFSVREPDDLKRREIAGLLPLWAGVTSEEQAARLVTDHIQQYSSFHRPHGVPSLAADDPSYDPRGYWNGPVWMSWNYLVFRGLLDQGYTEEAEDLLRRLTGGLGSLLGATHTFWEAHDPDQTWGGWHQSYIWGSLITRMRWDLQQAGTESIQR